VINDDIIVTMPGTDYAVTYYKRPKSPGLLAKRIADKDDPRAGLSLSDFLAAAWHLANHKARELGWIVWGHPPKKTFTLEDKRTEELIALVVDYAIRQQRLWWSQETKARETDHASAKG
jgi:hypothetical protein